MSDTFVIALLALTLGIQPVTTDLYLPALPGLMAGFGASLAQAQFTLTSLLLAFGVSQLFWGPLSDRIGRRPVLLWGLALYCLAAAGSTQSASIESLIAWRTLLGVAMGAVVMCARAIVRDLYAPLEGARIMSKGMTGLGLMAFSSPLLGGWLTQHWGWSVALQALTLYGLVCGGVMAWKFRETCAQRNPQALHARVMLANWRLIVRHPTFRAFAALTVSAYGMLFTFLASSSFIFLKVLGQSGLHYGMVLASMSLVYVLGTLLCRRLLLRVGIRRTVAVGGLLSALGGWGMLLSVLVLGPSVASLMPPFYLAVLAHGIHQPVGQSGAVGPFPQAAGAASALNGFSMMVTAFVIGLWLGQAMDGTVMPLVYGMAFWGSCLALVSWTLVRWHGEAHGRV